MEEFKVILDQRTHFLPRMSERKAPGVRTRIRIFDSNEIAQIESDDCVGPTRSNGKFSY